MQTNSEFYLVNSPEKLLVGQREFCCNFLMVFILKKYFLIISSLKATIFFDQLYALSVIVPHGTKFTL